MREQRHLGLDELLAHHLGVTALAGALFLELEHEKLGVHAFDLLLDLGAGVEGTHDGAHALGRTDRGKPCHAGPDNEDDRRLDAPGRRDLPAEKSAVMLCRLDDRAVAGDIRHRAQRIELLGPRDSRHTVNCQRGDPGAGESREHIGILCRPEKTDQRLPAAEAIDLVVTLRGVDLRRAHLEHDIASPPQRLRIGLDRRPGRRIGFVTEARCAPGTRLDANLETETDELRNHLGRRRDAPFARIDLFRYSYSHYAPDFQRIIAILGCLAPLTVIVQEAP